MVKIVMDEMVSLMGGRQQASTLKETWSHTDIWSAGDPVRPLFSGKLSLWLKKRKSKVLLVACDVYRPAAIDQLSVVAESVVEVYKEIENKTP